MSKYVLITLSVIGGLLSGLAWTGWCTGLILLIAFVPFFLIENHLFERAERYSTNAFFIYLLPGFLIFGMIALGWMKIASLTGVIFIIIGLSFIMAFTMWLAHVVRLRAGNLAGLIAMITFWLAYEFISLNVNLISPWINLGNGLAKDILFIQWYEFTGTAGGTLWILLSNLSLSYLLINTQIEKRHNIIIFLIWIAIVTVPPIISVARYFTIKQNSISAGEVLIIQPNIDPYTEKFHVPFEDQLSGVLNLAGTAITDNTSWVITPETTVDDPVNLDDLNNDRYIKMIKELTQEYPGVSVVSGFVSYKLYPPSTSAPTISARITDGSGLYSDHFNSAMKIDTGKNIEVYHKSKLVPGIEMQFSNGPGRLIAEILPYLGGTKWGYGTQEERECFEHNILKYKVAPIICYESVFGSFVTAYVRNGASVLFIITNDGWWKNTNGYKQHLAFASLRAIETRRQVVRAANTGVSCIIDIKGKVIKETEWWTQTVLKGEIYPETIETVYVKYGDYLMRIASTTAVFLILIVFIAVPVKNKRNGLTR